MRIVIVGGSKFGTATAEHLIEQGHEVVLIDKNRDKLDRLSEHLDCGMIEGDGTSPSVLRDAQSDGDDVLIALTNESDDNILAALVGRSVGYARVIPQIISTELLEVCTELGLDDTIMPHVTVARSLCRGLEEHAEVNTDMNLSQELRLKRVSVPERLAGQTVADLELKDSMSPVALIRDGAEHLIQKDQQLQEKDDLLFAVVKHDVEKLQALFEG